jgi:DNA adenine methylase
MSSTSTPSEETDYFEWIYPRLPTSSQYVELSSSSLVLLPWRQAAGVETLNDQTGHVRLFYKILRENESELINFLEDGSRISELVEDGLGVEGEPSETPSDLSELERAVSFFVRAGGLSPPTHPESTPGGWAFHVSNSGIEGEQSPSRYKIQHKLHDVANRIRRVQIENKSVAEVIDRYDDEETLFYGDWSVSNRELSDEIFEALKSSQSKIAIVTNGSQDSLPSETWNRTEIPDHSIPGTDSTQKPDQRVLYTNYDPLEIEEGSLSNGEYSIQQKISAISGDGEVAPDEGSSPRGGKLLPFRWYGGKYSHLKWLQKALPESEDISSYIEPFGGSGAVLLNRKPCETEVYNDIDSDVTNFFEVLKSDKEELLRNIALTPFSREELGYAAEFKGGNGVSELERARLFFVRAGQTRSGLAQEASSGRWAYCKTTSRRNMSGAVSRWHGRLEQLYHVADRLKGVDIRNENALDIIQEAQQDSLVYCDPPYPHETRGDTNSYGFEMTDDDHRELAEALQNCKGKVAISSYESDLYNRLYSGWYRVKSPEKTVHTNKDTARECLWTNYDPRPIDLEGVDVKEPEE